MVARRNSVSSEERFKSSFDWRVGEEKEHGNMELKTTNDQFNPLSANPTKWSNTLKQFIGCCRRIV